MSELKEIELGEAYKVFDDDKEFYLKSEADKVIAELEERIADGDKDFEMTNHQNKRLLKIVRHQKYKRCLAMAKVCKLKRFDEADYRIPRRKWDFYDKWLKRWMELAERFKEAK